MKTNMIILHNEFWDGKDAAAGYDIVMFQKEYEWQDIKNVVEDIKNNFEEYEEEHEGENFWDILMGTLEDKFGKVKIYNLAESEIAIEW